jgi:hypothetical protein
MVCFPAWISDSQAIEAKLTPHQSILDQIQAILFWKNPLVMGILLVVVNFLFWFVHKQGFSFLPTFFFLLTLKSLVQAVLQSESLRGRLSSFFPEVQRNPNDVYKIFTVEQISSVLAQFGDFVNSLESATLTYEAVVLFGMVLLFAFFKITGTLWVNVVVVNLGLLLPAVVLHPIVQKLGKQVLSWIRR